MWKYVLGFWKYFAAVVGAVVMIGANLQTIKSWFSKEISKDDRETIQHIGDLSSYPNISTRLKELRKLPLILEREPRLVPDARTSLADFVRHETRWHSTDARCADSQVKKDDREDVRLALQLLLKRHKSADYAERPLDLSSTNLYGLIYPASDGPRDSADLRRFNLRGACLSTVELPNAFLDGAQLQHALLDTAVLRHASLIGTQLDNASGTHTVFSGATLDSASLKRVVFPNASFRGTTLRCSDIVGATLLSINLDDAKLEWSLFDNTIIDVANVYMPDSSHLTGAFLDEVTLEPALREWLLRYGAAANVSKSKWRADRDIACRQRLR